MTLPFSLAEQEILQKVELFVQDKLTDAEKGHDWWHIQRVYNTALKLGETEKCDLFIVALSALLHDIADEKFKKKNEADAAEQIANLLSKLNCHARLIDQVVYCVDNVSYKNTFNGHTIEVTAELAVLQDADRLDAIGAIGIARAFHYGGHKNREMYNPAVPPIQYASKEEYLNTNAPTLNHFYEKLLLLKNLMLTETGKKIALEKHNFMLQFLEQFYSDCGIIPFK